jgi:hypothetical protein
LEGSHVETRYRFVFVYWSGASVYGEERGSLSSFDVVCPRDVDCEAHEIVEVHVMCPPIVYFDVDY